MERQRPSDMHALQNEDNIRRYLLGDPSLDEELRAAIEDAYFGDDAGHAKVLEMEDELVDSYVFRELTAQELIWFEDGLRKSARRRQKVELAKSLVRYASGTSPEARATRRFRWLRVFEIPAMRPAWRLGVACALVLVLAGSVALLNMFRTHHEESGGSRVAVQEPPAVPAMVPRAGPQQPSPDQGDRKASPAVLSFILVPDLTRGNGEMTTVKIPKGDYTVSLRMDRAAESYARYEATLATAERRVVASQANLTPRTAGAVRTVAFTLPSDRLVPGVYILNLKGGIRGQALDDLDDYTFQVIDK